MVTIFTSSVQLANGLYPQSLFARGVYKTDTCFSTEALFFTLTPKPAPENQVNLNGTVSPLLVRITSTASTTEPKEYLGQHFQKEMVSVSTQRVTNSPEF